MNGLAKLGLISIVAGITILATMGFTVIISSALAQTNMSNATMGNATMPGNATTTMSGQISGKGR
jgi:hypothetical protein